MNAWLCGIGGAIGGMLAGLLIGRSFMAVALCAAGFITGYFGVGRAS